MALNTKVKWYTNAMAGAPSFGYATDRLTPGKAIYLLDALLVNGFGLVTLDSVVINNNVATATRSVGHGFLVGQVIEIAGATPSGLNGEWRVSAATGTTFTFSTSGISNQTASGTITCKTPGLGWEIVFTDTNKRVYRSQNPDSPRSYFRVDDSSGSVPLGILNAYGYMSDIDSGTELWVPGTDGSYAIGIARPNHPVWFAVGDDRTIHIGSENFFTNGASVNFVIHSYGDYFSLKPNDTKNELVACHMNASGSSNSGTSCFTSIGNVGYSAVGRYLRQLNVGVNGRFRGVAQCNALSGYSGLPFPSSVDNGIIVTDALIAEETGTGNYPIRGKVRGAYWVMSDQPLAASYALQFVEGVVGLEGKLCGVGLNRSVISTTSGAFYNGRVLFDLYGPWD